MAVFGAPADRDRDSARGIDRRTVLRAGAWSVPVIAVAVASPLAAASGEPDPAECVVLPTGGFTVLGGTLSSNGSTGAVPTADGNFGTGWTPPQSPGGDWQTGYTQTAYAVAPTPASWWSGGGSTNEPGFLSMDDNDNRDAAPHDETTVFLQFAAEMEAGRSYTFALPVYTSRPDLGVQYLDISVSGSGVSQPGAVQGYVGDKAISVEPAGLGAYTSLSASQMPMVTFTSDTAGTVTFSYTFTLAYVSGGARQNADILVQAPQLLACV